VDLSLLYLVPESLIQRHAVTTLHVVDNNQLFQQHLVLDYRDLPSDPKILGEVEIVHRIHVNQINDA
jgi:hypothetical protein